MNFNNSTPSSAPIFQPQTQPLQNLPPQTQTQNQTQTSNPFDKLLSKKISNQDTTSQEKKLEDYRKQIEQLDLEQLKMERKRLVDLIVKYMNEGNRELLEEHQRKYKIAMEVSDSKVMNFSASSIAQKQPKQNTTETIAQNTTEDILKKLQESEILPPDNSQPPTIPPQTQISQLNPTNNNTDTQITSINNNPNVQVFSIPQTNQAGITNQSLINTINSMNTNQLNSLFSNPQGIFNSLNSLSNAPTNIPQQNIPNLSNLSFGLPINPEAPVNPYSPLMTMYGMYVPGLRNDPRMNAFLNGELYPQDIADLGVWSAINNELFKKSYNDD